MKRKHLEHCLDKFKSEIPELADSPIRLFLDIEDEDKSHEIIFEIVKPFNKKFKLILALILKGKYHKDLYDIEDTNVTAMKFKGKVFKNARIYCKEVFKDGKKVVMVSRYYKKVEANQDDPKILKIIEDIKSYEYEF